MEIKTQQDVNECGLVIVQSLHRHFYDKWININKLKHSAKINEKGMTITNLKELGQTYGIILEAYKGDFDTYVNSENKDYVITMVQNNGENHFVFFKIGKKKVLIIDPIKGSYKMDLLKFKEIFTGVVITFEKGEYRERKIKKNFSLNILFKNPTLFSWIVISIILSLVLTFSSTIFTKIIFDSVLPARLNQTLIVLTIGFAWIALVRSLNNFLKKYLIKKYQNNIEVKMTLEYFKSMRNGKSEELSKISQSDHLRRISLIASTSSFLAHSIFVSFSETINFIVAISLLIWISPSMFGIALAAGGVISCLTILIQFRSKTKYDDLLENQLSYLNTSMDHAFSMDQVKEPVAKLQLKRMHESRYEKYKKTEWSLWRYSNSNVLLSEVINFTFPIVLTYIGVKNVFDQHMTIGSVMMFLSLFHWFIQPIENISSLAINYRKNMNNYTMINFILNIGLEKYNPNGLMLEKIERISLNDYSFGYDKNLFSVIWWELKENIHITGVNGSGKSTLLKILANRIKGTGAYSINGMESEYYNLDSINEKIFYLSGNPYIFEGSVFEFITLNNKEAISRFNKSMLNYNLGKLFKELDISPETIIRNNGTNLSSGQKQIISLMRLFAFDYQLIILDEALENIDMKKVEWFSKSIPQIQKGIFIEVSHSKKYLTAAKEVQIEDIVESEL